MTGQTISHYRIVEKIGEGGMGVVYRAQDTKLERTVALKFLAAHLLNDVEAKQRFLREAKAAAALDHPNICTVHEIDEADGKVFLAMAFLAGETLEERIAKGPLPLEDALDIARQVAEGLNAAHAAGVVHRDIKPANILVSPEGRATIMDFGLARLTEASKLTQQDQTVGTAAYMSPEQLQGGEVDHRTDVWALGCVLYEMVAGVRSFKGQYDQALAYEIVHEEPESLTAVRSGVPMELEFFVGKCLAKSKEERYRDAADLALDLRNLSEKLRSGRSMAFRPAREASPTGPSSAVRPTTKRQAALALCVAVIAGLLGWGWGRSGAESPTAERTHYSYRQLTFDSGLTYQPALSPDGQLVAYASDRAGNGDLDIWVQRIDGGDPIRLTQDPSDDSTPTFSPDGSQIAFRSERNGGGVYVVPAFGGNERLLIPEGREPRFSPDGSEIAYWVGSLGAQDSNRAFLIPAEGGEPRPVAASFFRTDHPMWSPDGRYILFSGDRGARVERDWWLTPREGGEPIRTGVQQRLRRFGLRPPPLRYDVRPEAWLPGGGSVLFVARTGEEVGVWAIDLELASGRTVGDPWPLASGPSTIGTVASNSLETSIVISEQNGTPDLWELPIDSRTAEVTGSLQRLVDSVAGVLRPYLLKNGHSILFTEGKTTGDNIALLDLRTRRIDRVGSGLFAIANRDGTTIALRSPGVSAFVETGSARRDELNVLCIFSDWSWDDSTLACFETAPAKVELVDRDSRQSTTIAQHREYTTWDPRFSPDDRWITFHSRTSPTSQQIFVIPVPDQGEVPEEEWIEITDGTAMDRAPAWSPDGNLLYFTSERTGSRAIWAQRLDAQKRPLGDPVLVKDFPEARRSLFNVLTVGELGLQVARDRLIFATAELSGNVWLLSPITPSDVE